MNSNIDANDLTQYSLRCANILGNIFESIDKYHLKKDNNNYLDKLSENITNFELTLDKCFIDVNESISKVAKTKFEKRNPNSNINQNRNPESNQNDIASIINEEQISDEELVKFVIDGISNIKLKV